MSEVMDIENNKETIIALAIVSCVMMLKICIIAALFSMYSEHRAMVRVSQSTYSFIRCR